MQDTSFSAPTMSSGGAGIHSTIEANAAESKGLRSLNGEPYTYPDPVCVRNTFVVCVTDRPPSFDEFFQERQVQSCPASCFGSECGEGEERHEVQTTTCDSTDSCAASEAFDGELTSEPTEGPYSRGFFNRQDLAFEPQPMPSTPEAAFPGKSIFEQFDVAAPVENYFHSPPDFVHRNPMEKHLQSPRETVHCNVNLANGYYSAGAAPTSMHTQYIGQTYTETMDQSDSQVYDTSFPQQGAHAYLTGASGGYNSMEFSIIHAHSGVESYSCLQYIHDGISDYQEQRHQFAERLVRDQGLQHCMLPQQARAGDMGSYSHPQALPSNARPSLSYADHVRAMCFDDSAPDDSHRLVLQLSAAIEDSLPLAALASQEHQHVQQHHQLAPRRSELAMSAQHAPMPPAAKDFEASSLPSLGSAAHAAGRCKPCAFLYNKGCDNGYNCPFCHICEAGEKKKRRKEKVDSQRCMRKIRQGPPCWDGATAPSMRKDKT